MTLQQFVLDHMSIVSLSIVLLLFAIIAKKIFNECADSEYKFAETPNLDDSVWWNELRENHADWCVMARA